MAMFGKIKITGKIELLTGMHIGGSKEFSAIGAIDSPVIRDSYSGNPIIPGSSLKGKMRTLLARKYSDSGLPKPHNEDSKEILRLFGSSGDTKRDATESGIQQSRLLFSDMFLNKDNEKELKNVVSFVTEIKFENTINRLTAEAMPRQIERTIRGTEFDLNIIYNIYNIEAEKEIEEDFETIHEGFTLLEYDYLGGHGSRGYGRIKIKDLKAEPVLGEIDSSIVDECNRILKNSK